MRLRIHTAGVIALATVIGFLTMGCPVDSGDTETVTVTVSVPTANPAGGEVAFNTEITLSSATEGARIYYTQDGTTPDTESKLYSDNDKPVITAETLTLKAVAVKEGIGSSAVMEELYTILLVGTAATPTANPPDGAAAANTEITLVSATEGARIYYTLDGTAPTAASTLYSDSDKPRVAADVTLKALAVKDGMNASKTLTTSYTINTITGDSGIKMVQIAAGKFMMGSPVYEPKYNKQENLHEVTLTKDFYMSVYEVTQAQYTLAMNSNPSMYSGDNLPVERVNWFDVLVFCNKLSVKEGLTPVYSINGKKDPSEWGTVPRGRDANPPAGLDAWKPVAIDSEADGYRMPTEAEWEYACRAGASAAFSWGTDQITTAQANFDGSDARYLYNNSPLGTYLEKTVAVGSYAPNKWGLFDMHGNVNEWCWDYHERTIPYSTDEEDCMDPTGPADGRDKVQRGGSWYNFGERARSAYRECFPPWIGSSSACGIRLVRGR